jgi:hypothetical protein
MLKKCPPWVSIQSMQEMKLLEPFNDISLWSRLPVTSCTDSLCFLSALLGPYFHQFSLQSCNTVSYIYSFHNCFKMWICRLGFIYGSCIILLHHILYLQFENSWMFFWNKVSYIYSFHSCFKMWICRLGFIYGSCIILLHHILYLQFENSWMFFWNNG